MTFRPITEVQAREVATLGEDELCVTVDRARRLLGISRPTAYLAVREGRIPSFRIGRCIRVPAAPLRTMLAGPGYQSKLGRPAGRKAPRRPVVTTRVPQELYEQICAAAKTAGRTISEELVWRVQQSFLLRTQRRPR